VGAGFARAVLDPFSGYGVFNLLGKTHSIEEFISTIQSQAMTLEIECPSIHFSPEAEPSPFIYELNDEATRIAFPLMPRTSLDEGVRQSLIYFQGLSED
jgi:hypothetical protein